MKKLILAALAMSFASAAGAAALTKGAASTPATKTAELSYEVNPVDPDAPLYIQEPFTFTVSPNVSFKYDEISTAAVAGAASAKGTGAVFAASSTGGSVGKCAGLSQEDPFATPAAAVTAVGGVGIDATTGTLTGCGE